jgi:rRNA maturation RNase YbeY
MPEICGMVPTDAHDLEGLSPSGESSIEFFTEDLDFALDCPEEVRGWIIATVDHEGFAVDSLSFIFCSDAHLLGINQQYLEHDTFTDIITFPYHEEERRIQGDVFISVERVQENATTYGVPFERELHRVIIHGVLHLLGYVDGSDADKAFMRKKEDFYLARRQGALAV